MPTSSNLLSDEEVMGKAPQEPQQQSNLLSDEQVGIGKTTVGFTGEAAPGIGSRRTGGLLGLFSIPNIIEGIYNTAKAAPEVTRRAMQGELDPASEQGIREVFPLAGLAALPSAGRTLARPPASAISEIINPSTVKDAGSLGFKRAEGLGIEVAPDAVWRGAKGIKKYVDGLIGNPDVAPLTSQFLERKVNEWAPNQPDAMASLTQTKPSVKGPADISDINLFRRTLNDIRNDSNASNTDKLAAAHAIKATDYWLSRVLKPGDAVKGGENVPLLSRIIEDARADWTGGLRGQAIENLIERARLSAGKSGNLEGALQTELKNFVRPNDRGVSEASSQGFNAREIAGFKAIVKKGGGKVKQFVEQAGGGSPLRQGLTGYLATQALGPIGLGVPLAGAAAKGLGNMKALKATESIMQDTLNRAPMAKPFTQPGGLGILGLPQPALPPASLGATLIPQYTGEGYPFYQR